MPAGNFFSRHDLLAIPWRGNFASATLLDRELRRSRPDGAATLQRRPSRRELRWTEPHKCELQSAQLDRCRFHRRQRAWDQIAPTYQQPVYGTVLTGTGISAAQLYSTASYQSHDLTNIDLSGNNLAGWNFVGQNLAAQISVQSNLLAPTCPGQTCVGQPSVESVCRSFTRRPAICRTI